MKTSTIVKLNFLALGLGLTIYFIHALNTNGLSPRLQALFGLPVVKKSANQGAYKWNWCNTRVAALIRPEQFKISQDGPNWVHEASQSKVIDFIAFEKWLARSCAVPAAKVQLAEDASFVPALMVKFINGQVDVIKRNAHGVFSWKGQVLASPAFDAALEELSSLPEGRRK